MLLLAIVVPETVGATLASFPRSVIFQFFGADVRVALEVASLELLQR